jgi:ribosomal protein S18 acetylase RimI-like enzyme
MLPLIRPYDDTSDRAAMIGFYRDVWHATYDAVDGAAAIDTLIANLLESEPPDMFVLPVGDVALVAVDGGAIVGGVRGHPRGGILHLSGFYVRALQQRRGIGRALLAHVIRQFQSDMTVQADVRPTSAEALAFYEAHGFVRVGSGRAGVGGGLWVDTVEMQRALG